MKRNSNVNKSSKQSFNAVDKSLIGKDNEIIINREKRVFSSANAKKPIIKENSVKAANSTNSGKKTEIFQKKTTVFTRNKEASPTRASDIYKSAVNAENKMGEKTGITYEHKPTTMSDIKKAISDTNKVTIDLTKITNKNADMIRASDPNKLNTISDLNKIPPNKKTIQKK